MEAAHDNFYKQLCRCQSMQPAIEKYDLDIHPGGQTLECDARLKQAVQKLLNRERQNSIRDQWEGELHNRNKLPSGVGGPGVCLLRGLLKGPPWPPP